MLVASFSRRHQAKEQRIWATATLMMGLAYALFAGRDTVPLIWSLVLGNAIFTLAFAAYTLAISRLLKRPAYAKSMLIVALIGAASLYYMEIVRGTSAYRIPILSLPSLYVWGIAFAETLRDFIQRRSAHVGAMGLVFLGLIGVSLLRLGWSQFQGYLGYQGLPTGHPMLVASSFMLMLATPLLTVGFFMLCTEQDQKKLEALALEDPLTGIANRRAVLELAEHSVHVARRQDTPLACVLFDIDHFKDINDHHGHAAGDAVLIHLANTITARLREGDIFGRVGGEEFLLILPNTTLQGAVQLADVLRQQLTNLPMQWDKLRIDVSASFGVTALQATDQSLETLLQRADMAMYRAKEAGRNQVQALSPNTPPPSLASDPAPAS